MPLLLVHAAVATPVTLIRDLRRPGGRLRDVAADLVSVCSLAAEALCGAATEAQLQR